MAQPTPGPWEVVTSTGLGLVVLRQKGARDSFAEIFYSPDAPVPDGLEADARLIAAAPDLLAALRRLLLEADAVTVAHGGVPGISDRWAAAAVARAAIAKAEGSP